MWPKETAANQLVANDSRVEQQEQTQGVCVATQTWPITLDSTIVSVSTGHRRILAKILLHFVPDTMSEVPQQCITMPAVTTAMTLHPIPVMLPRGRGVVLATTADLADKTKVVDESSITLTVAAAINNMLVKKGVNLMITWVSVGNGWTALKVAASHRQHSHGTREMYQSCSFAVMVHAQGQNPHSPALPTAATKSTAPTAHKASTTAAQTAAKHLAAAWTLNHMEATRVYLLELVSLYALY